MVFYHRHSGLRSLLATSTPPSGGWLKNFREQPEERWRAETAGRAEGLDTGKVPERHPELQLQLKRSHQECLGAKQVALGTYYNTKSRELMALQAHSCHRNSWGPLTQRLGAGNTNGTALPIHDFYLETANEPQLTANIVTQQRRGDI
jgi:hypothetical protein